MPEPAVKMTRAEYAAKYGQPPTVKMTKAEYNAKYGQAPYLPTHLLPPAAATPQAPVQAGPILESSDTRRRFQVMASEQRQYTNPTTPNYFAPVMAQTAQEGEGEPEPVTPPPNTAQPFQNPAVEGFVQGGMNVAGAVTRGMAALNPLDSLLPQAADAIAASTQAREAKAAEGSGAIGTAVRGAVSSLTGMAPTAMAGGPYGAILSAMAMQGEDALQSGRGKGMKGKELEDYIIRSMLVEGVPAGAMQAAGFGGLESVLASPIGQGTLRQAVRQAVISTALEVPEELGTEVGHAANDQRQTQMGQTALQTVFAGGMANTPNLVASTGQGASETPAKSRMDTLREMRLAKRMVESTTPDSVDAAIQEPGDTLVGPGARVSSGFGSRVHPLDNVTKDHKGIDLAIAEGTGVSAHGDGVVVKAGPAGGYGNMVEIQHADGTRTRYAHLKDIYPEIQVGTAVTGGTSLGTVGQTGKATGPHLHFELINAEGKAVDPAPVLSGAATPQSPTAPESAPQETVAPQTPPVAAKPAPAPPAPVKKPQEMTQEEWLNPSWKNDLDIEIETAGQAARAANKSQGEIEKAQQRARLNFFRRLKEPGSVYRTGPNAIAKHREEILNAQALGETIPPEVLAAYPDMQPKPTSIPRRIQQLRAQRAEGASLRDLGRRPRVAAPEPTPSPPASPTPPAQKQPWEMRKDEFQDSEALDRELRSQYVSPDGRVLASSRTTPAKESTLPIGTWRIEKMPWSKYGDNIEQLREINVSEIKGSEDTTPDRMQDVDRYASWLKEGKNPPPFRVAALQDGGYKLMDGHRRLLSYQKAGIEKARAWVADSADTGLRDPQGKVIDTDLTHQLSVKAAIARGDITSHPDYPDLTKEPRNEEVQGRQEEVAADAGVAEAAPAPTPANEDAARAVGDDPKLLEKRLMEAVGILKDRAEFKDATFDFDNKRLVGKNGAVLQWRLRNNPDKPVAYENQQTNRGGVYYEPPAAPAPPPPIRGKNMVQTLANMAKGAKGEVLPETGPLPGAKKATPQEKKAAMDKLRAEKRAEKDAASKPVLVEDNEALRSWRDDVKQRGVRLTKAGSGSSWDDYGGLLPPGYHKKAGGYTWDQALQVARDYGLRVDNLDPSTLRNLLRGPSRKYMEMPSKAEQAELDAIKEMEKVDAPSENEVDIAVQQALELYHDNFHEAIVTLRQQLPKSDDEAMLKKVIRRLEKMQDQKDREAKYEPPDPQDEFDWGSETGAALNPFVWLLPKRRARRAKPTGNAAIDNLDRMFERGELQRRQILELQEERGRISAKSLTDWALRHFADVRFGLPRELRKAAGDRAYVPTRIHQMLREIEQQTFDILGPAKVSVADFTKYLALRRMETERGNMKNPLSPADVQSARDYLKNKVGARGWAAMEDAADARHKSRLPLMDELVDTGLISQELGDRLKLNDAYATFNVLDFLEESYGKAPGAGIFKQLGTERDIEDVYTATALKDTSMLYASTINRAVRDTVKWLEANDPTNVAPATQQGTMFAPAKNPDAALVRYREEGKLKGAYIPKTMAKALSIDPHEMGMALQIADTLNAPFRAIYTVNNPLFGIWNTQRDFQSNYMKLPGNPLTQPFSLARAYSQVFKDAALDVFVDRRSPFLEDLYKKGAFIEGRTYRNREFDAETEMERLQMRFNVNPGVKSNWAKRILKGVFVDFNQFTERLGKAAGAKYLQNQGYDFSDPATIEMIRNRAGSPDFLAKGHYGTALNQMFLFSNANIQGVRGLIEATKENPGQTSAKMALVLAPKLLMKAAAAGMLGAYIAKVMAGIPDRDKENYVTVPLGLTDKDESIYFVMPQDHSTQILGNIAWLAMNQSNGWRTEEIVRALAAQNPYQGSSVAPAIRVLSDVISAASGINPIDTWSGREMVGEIEFDAGGTNKWGGLAQAEFNKIFGGIAFKIKSGSESEIASDFAKKMSTPGLEPVLRRFIRVSKKGVEDQYRKDIAPIQQEDARRSLLIRDVVSTAVAGFPAGLSKAGIRARATRAYNKAVREKAIPRDYPKSAFSLRVQALYTMRYGTPEERIGLNKSKAIQEELGIERQERKQSGLGSFGSLGSLGSL